MKNDSISCNFSCFYWPPDVSMPMLSDAPYPDELLLAFDSIASHFFFVVAFLLEAKFNLLSALLGQIYAFACARTLSTVLAAMPFFKILKLLLALIFRCAHFKSIATATASSDALIKR